MIGSMFKKLLKYSKGILVRTQEDRALRPVALTPSARGSRAHTYFSRSRRRPQHVFRFPMACPSCRNPAFRGTPISWAATPAVDIVSRTAVRGLCQSSSSCWYLEGERRDERGPEAIHKYRQLILRNSGDAEQENLVTDFP